MLFMVFFQWEQKAIWISFLKYIPQTCSIKDGSSKMDVKSEAKADGNTGGWLPIVLAEIHSHSFSTIKYSFKDFQNS